MQTHHFRWPETRLSDNEQYNDIFMEYHIPKGRNKIQQHNQLSIIITKQNIAEYESGGRNIKGI